MTSEEKLAKAMEEFNTIKQTIQDKYDTVMGKIRGLQSKLTNLANEVDKHTQKWIQEQQDKIQTKINDLKDKIEKWIQTQMAKLQGWLEEVQNEIKAFLIDLAVSMLTAISGI